MTIPIAIRKREPGLPGIPDYSRAFYCDPPSHDFCVWLVIAEMMRRYHEAPAPLRVKFGLVNGQLGAYEYGPVSPWTTEPASPCGLSREYSDQMMEHVLRPAIAMMGAIEEAEERAPFDQDKLRGWVEYDYHIRSLVNAGRQGYDPPKWQVPQWASDEVDEIIAIPPVVITLREVRAQPERNSQIEEWLQFADSIKDQHYVVFVRDTCRAHEPLSGFDICPRASENAFVRAALYQRAFCNLMVQTGPFVWVQFSNAPYLAFKQFIPALPDWDHGNAKGWREQDHMEIGDQYPWATPQQLLTWTDDTFENISRAFESVSGRLQAAA